MIARVRKIGPGYPNVKKNFKKKKINQKKKKLIKKKKINQKKKKFAELVLVFITNLHCQPARLIVTENCYIPECCCFFLINGQRKVKDTYQV